jgi:predicted phosphodiesterase
MSRIAILSDIHGNLPAFKAVLRDVQQSGATSLVFLGDIVGYGASPAQCVALVRKLGGHCVMGNHDEVIDVVRKPGFAFRDRAWKKCGYQAGLAHAAKDLDDDQAAWLAALPFTTVLPGAIAAHGSLDRPMAFNYIQDAASALPTLELLRERDTEGMVGFFGHTHETGVFSDRDELLEWHDDSRVQIPACLACAVTVGAVGQPRHPTDRRACWVLWDPDERVVEFHKTEYQRLQAAQDIGRAGLPMESAGRLLTDAEMTFLES